MSKPYYNSLSLQPVFCTALIILSATCLAETAAEDDTATKGSACNSVFSPSTPGYDFHRSDIIALPDKKINRIYVTRLPIFDESNEEENNWLYRWANRVHYLTNETQVREQLLFQEGDTYNSREIKESARLLRDLGFLYDANIHRTSTCDDSVDLEVVTRDVWSLTIDASFSRSGGQNDFRLGLGESNLFGTGQNVSIYTEEDDERKSTSFFYEDKNVRSTRIRTRLLVQDSDDGNQYAAALFLPFYALDAKRSWGVLANNTERVDTQYFRGEDVTEVRHNIDDLNLYYGFSKGLVNGKTQRWSFGYRYREDEFDVADDLPPPAVLPLDKTLSYPYVNLEIIEDNYTTAFNLDQINRTEDLHLGYSLNLNLGYAAESLGSNQDRLVFNGRISDTLLYTEKILLQHSLGITGLYNQETNKSEDVIADYALTYFRSQTTHRSLFAKLSLAWSENLDTDRQILLGGENGVRGFDRRLQSGDRRFVLTLEERQYTNIHLLNLAYLGFAVFIDVGRAWDPDVDEGFENDYLASAGFGIRLASSKSDSARVIHIDFAFPITNQDEPEVSSSDVSINVKSSL